MADLFYEGDSLKSASRVITWHRFEGFRVWVGSWRTAHLGLKVTTVTLEIPEEIEGQPSNSEVRRRLALIPRPSGEALESPTGILGAAFRAFPWREVIDECVGLISSAEAREDEQTRYGLSVVPDRRPALGSISSTHRDAIWVAYVYAEESAISQHKAASRTALRLGVDVRDVYVALQVARRSGWLTSVKQGRSGGELTELGRKAFEEYDGEERLAAFLRAGRGNW